MDENGPQRPQPIPLVQPLGHGETFDDDNISLWPGLMALWRERRRLLGIVGIAIGLFVFGVAALYAWLPTEKTAQIGFRLLFDGVDKGQYPNGTPFGPSDVTSVPILEEVYNANGLEQYSRFEVFKQSVFVKQANRALELLEGEFRAKLTDTKLTPVDRQRIERDFEARSKGLASSDFDLILIRRERFREISPTLARKVLSDILNAYASDADQKKGALKYRVSVPTTNIVQQDLLEQEDYIVALDILRNIVAKVQLAATKLQALPGADVIRVGSSRMALTDIQSNLDDLLRFRINPMIGFVRAIGVTKNPALTIQYLRNQLFTLNLDRTAATSQASVYADSLRTYVTQRPGASAESMTSPTRTSGTGGMGNTPALIPQLGDSFFDRLIELGTKGDDTQYRQSLINRATDSGMKVVELQKEKIYYEDLISVFEGASRNADQNLKKQFLEVFRARYPRALKDLLLAIDNVNLFYDTLSKQNLNPSTLLVEITTPASVTSQSALSFTRVFVVAVIYVVAVGVCVIVGFFVLARFREEKLA